MKIEPKIAAASAELTAIRRDIHAHPELGFEEERTSQDRGDQAQGMGLRGHDRHRQDRRRRHHPRRQQSARHRAARRHGCAADGRAQHLRPSQPPPGPHACLRPRRPHHDAAGRRQVPLGDPQLRRHGAFHLPAGRGGPRRRRGDGQGRAVREVPLRADLRHAQQAQARCRQVRHPLGPADGGRRPVRHQDHRQGRARRAAGDRHRSGDHRHPDHLGAAERGVAQRGARSIRR